MHFYAQAVLFISWAFWLWDTYLEYRQYIVYKTTQRVPKELKNQIDDETFKKSKSYSIDKARFGFISGLYGQIQSSLTIYYYLMPYFWDLSNDIMTKNFGFNRNESIEWEIFQSLMFTLITSVVSTLVNLPVSIYSNFVIEQRHGFNKQTAGFYAWDKIKKFAISFVISAPVLSAVIYIVRTGGHYFFLYLWMFCFLVVVLMTFFSGEILALFDKVTPLPEGELREKIEAIAREVKFPLSKIFVVEGSKRSSHSNAYLSGLFNRRRIVIYDTLIQGYYDEKKETKDKEEDEEESNASESEKDSNDELTNKKSKTDKKKGCNDDEIIAVLCHELGHWDCGHTIKFLTFVEINYFLMFLIFSLLYNEPTLYAAFGFFSEKPVIIGFALLMMILTPYNELQGFIGTSMSRRFEYQADEYAQKKGHADRLKTALVKLNIDNLGFPVYDELYSIFNHSHPSLIHRLDALSKSD